jgi:hypothetical protein
MIHSEATGCWSTKSGREQDAKLPVEPSNEGPDDLLPVCAAFTLRVRQFSGCGVTVQLEFRLDGEVQCVGLSR